eukprot:3823712-Rhodomonas_salina.1
MADYGNARDLDIAWLVACGTLVFLMQCWFTVLETGVMTPKSVTNILYNISIHASIAALCFWLLRWVAYGGSREAPVDESDFATPGIYDADGDGNDVYEAWFFQWVGAGAFATIVAGCIGERTKLEAYFVYSIAFTTFVYPVAVHWGWGAGWLSA